MLPAATRPAHALLQQSNVWRDLLYALAQLQPAGSEPWLLSQQRSWSTTPPASCSLAVLPIRSHAGRSNHPPSTLCHSCSHAPPVPSAPVPKHTLAPPIMYRAQQGALSSSIAGQQQNTPCSPLHSLWAQFDQPCGLQPSPCSVGEQQEPPRYSSLRARWRPRSTSIGTSHLLTRAVACTRSAHHKHTFTTHNRTSHSNTGAHTTYHTPPHPSPSPAAPSHPEITSTTSSSTAALQHAHSPDPPPEPPGPGPVRLHPSSLRVLLDDWAESHNLSRPVEEVQAREAALSHKLAASLAQLVGQAVKAMHTPPEHVQDMQPADASDPEAGRHLQAMQDIAAEMSMLDGLRGQQFWQLFCAAAHPVTGNQRILQLCLHALDNQAGQVDDGLAPASQTTPHVTSPGLPVWLHLQFLSVLNDSAHTWERVSLLALAQRGPAPSQRHPDTTRTRPAATTSDQPSGDDEPGGADAELLSQHWRQPLYTWHHVRLFRDVLKPSKGHTSHLPCISVPSWTAQPTTPESLQPLGRGASTQQDQVAGQGAARMRLPSMRGVGPSPGLLSRCYGHAFDAFELGLLGDRLQPLTRGELCGIAIVFGSGHHSARLDMWSWLVSRLSLELQPPAPGTPDIPNLLTGMPAALVCQLLAALDAAHVHAHPVMRAVLSHMLHTYWYGQPMKKWQEVLHKQGPALLAPALRLTARCIDELRATEDTPGTLTHLGTDLHHHQPSGHADINMQPSEGMQPSRISVGILRAGVYREYTPLLYPLMRLVSIQSQESLLLLIRALSVDCLLEERLTGVLNTIKHRIQSEVRRVDPNARISLLEPLLLSGGIWDTHAAIMHHVLTDLQTQQDTLTANSLLRLTAALAAHHQRYRRHSHRYSSLWSSHAVVDLSRQLAGSLYALLILRSHTFKPHQLAHLLGSCARLAPANRPQQGDGAGKQQQGMAAAASGSGSGSSSPPGYHLAVTVLQQQLQQQLMACSRKQVLAVVQMLANALPLGASVTGRHCTPTGAINAALMQSTLSAARRVLQDPGCPVWLASTLLTSFARLGWQDAGVVKLACQVIRTALLCDLTATATGAGPVPQGRLTQLVQPNVATSRKQQSTGTRTSNDQGSRIDRLDSHTLLDILDALGTLRYVDAPVLQLIGDSLAYRLHDNKHVE